jgi:hypothetical protein
MKSIDQDRPDCQEGNQTRRNHLPKTPKSIKSRHAVACAGFREDGPIERHFHSEARGRPAHATEA